MCVAVAREFLSARKGLHPLCFCSDPELEASTASTEAFVQERQLLLENIHLQHDTALHVDDMFYSCLSLVPFWT